MSLIVDKIIKNESFVFAIHKRKMSAQRKQIKSKQNVLIIVPIVSLYTRFGPLYS